MRASRLRFGTLNGFLGEVLCISDSFETLKLVFFDTILEFDIVATGLELLQRQRRETMTLNYHLAERQQSKREVHTETTCFAGFLYISLSLTKQL